MNLRQNADLYDGSYKVDIFNECALTKFIFKPFKNKDYFSVEIDGKFSEF